MNSEQMDVDLEQWFSSYGLITVERILGKYQIKLPHELLISAIKKQSSFYHFILQIPLKNVLTGIVLQQAHDYHVYAQKLYIDYVLSSEAGTKEANVSSSARETLDEERKKLIIMGEEFHQGELTQLALIAKSQAYLMEVTKQWNTKLDSTIHTLKNSLNSTHKDIKPSSIRHAIEYAIVHYDVKESELETNKYALIDKLNEQLKLSLSVELKDQLLNELNPLIDFSIKIEEGLSDFYPQTTYMSDSARTFRTQMHESILTAVELMKILPDYRIDPIQDLINRESLYFDKTLGERSR